MWSWPALHPRCRPKATWVAGLKGRCHRPPLTRTVFSNVFQKDRWTKPRARLFCPRSTRALLDLSLEMLKVTLLGPLKTVFLVQSHSVLLPRPWKCRSGWSWGEHGRWMDQIKLFFSLQFLICSESGSMPDTRFNNPSPNSFNSSVKWPPLFPIASLRPKNGDCHVQAEMVCP